MARGGRSALRPDAASTTQPATRATTTATSSHRTRALRVSARGFPVWAPACCAGWLCAFRRCRRFPRSLCRKIDAEAAALRSADMRVLSSRDRDGGGRNDVGR